MLELLLAACALMMIFEGILPFAAPQLWRDGFRRLAALSDGQLRFGGLALMLGGLMLLVAVS